MCGIVGKISLGEKPIERSAVLAMTTALAHRGLDGTGVYISPDRKVGLGHRRLAIIDLSKKASQPMAYQNRYQIVFNGEIYNFLEKRKLLENLGYTFHSNSDTEVILALYDLFGVKCLDHLRGMFSFAIYDQKNKTLFCARDRVGKKPFKYYSDGAVFIFASELKAILTQNDYRRQPDFLAIHHYLSFQYCPNELTGFKGIKKLPPAHYLLLDIKTKKIEIIRYWKLDYSQKLILSEADWEKAIIDKLDESVKLRLVADVPVGAFLSGGVDSSAVVGLMSRHSRSPIQTFSIGFEEERYDELNYARLIAKKFNTDHTEFILKPESADILPSIVKQYEEPFADSSALPTYFLSELTGKKVSVALTGDGGDENFAGYSRYGVYKTYLSYAKLARFLMPLISRIKNTNMSIADSRHLYGDMMSYFTKVDKQQLYSRRFEERVGECDSAKLLTDLLTSSGSRDNIDQVLYTDFVSYLPSDLMVKVDIAAMAHGLETRCPLLDHEFIELTAKIPSQLKLKGLSGNKYIFKKALAKLLPPNILRRRKMGFGAPIESWFRDDLASYVSSRLLSEQAQSRDIFNQTYVRELIADHKTGRANNSYRLWALLTLELWLEIYF